MPPQVVAPLAPPPPGQSGVLATLRERWQIVALAILVCLVFVIPIAAIQSPTYTANSRLIVRASGGDTDVLEAAETLAATYSRAVTAEFVIAPLARETGLPKGDILARLSASPVPESAVFFIEATGPTERSAIDLASRATTHLLAWIRRVTEEDRVGQALSDEISAAATAAARAAERESDARGAFGANPSAANRRLLERARAERLAAEVRLEGLRSVYAETRLSTALGHAVTILNPPAQAASDRRSSLQKLILGALLAGLLAGCGLAFAVDRFRRTADVEVGPAQWTRPDVAAPSEPAQRSHVEG